MNAENTDPSFEPLSAPKTEKLREWPKPRGRRLLVKLDIDDESAGGVIVPRSEQQSLEGRVKAVVLDISTQCEDGDEIGDRVIVSRHDTFSLGIRLQQGSAALEVHLVDERSVFASLGSDDGKLDKLFEDYGHELAGLGSAAGVNAKIFDIGGVRVRVPEVKGFGPIEHVAVEIPKELDPAGPNYTTITGVCCDGSVTGEVKMLFTEKLDPQDFQDALNELASVLALAAAEERDPPETLELEAGAVTLVPDDPSEG